MNYRYKNETYTLLYYAKMKDIQSGLWFSAAAYKNASGEVFVREKRDFKNKFERVE